MKILVYLCLVMPAHIMYSQEAGDCRVMLPALQGTYNGGCKNGLAQGNGTAKGTDTYSGNFRKGYPHGKGTYSWKSGNIYKGEWNNGLREGEGTLTVNIGDRDSVISGIWKEDHFIGVKPSAPKIIQKYNISSTSFLRTGEGNKIAISFYQNGMNNIVEALDIVTNSGTESRAGKNINFWDIRFPFHCKVNYMTWNSLRTVQYNCVLEFEISQPGSWDLRIGN